MYSYPNFKLVRVVDGDTVEVMIDLGFREFTRQLMPLKPTGKFNRWGKPDDVEAVTKWLTDRLTDPSATLWLESTAEQGKDGHYLATLYDLDVNINQEMINLGLAWQYAEPKEIEALKRKQQDCGRF